MLDPKPLKGTTITDKQKAEQANRIAVADALGREIQRARERDGEEAYADLLGALAKSLPSDYVAKMLGTHLVRDPQAAAEAAKEIPIEKMGKLVAAQIDQDPEAAAEITAELSDEQKGTLAVALADDLPAEQKGKLAVALADDLSEDDLLAMMAAKFRLSVDDLKKQLGIE